MSIPNRIQEFAPQAQLRSEVNVDMHAIADQNFLRGTDRGLGISVESGSGHNGETRSRDQQESFAERFAYFLLISLLVAGILVVIYNFVRSSGVLGALSRPTITSHQVDRTE